jgi:hypothetical protein
MGAPRTKSSLVLAVLTACALAACGDPDQYLRHAKTDAGTLPIMTGGSGGSTGVAGAETSGAAGANSPTGGAGTPGAVSGGAGASTTGGAAGAGATTGAAGAATSTGAAGTTTGAAGAATTGAAGAAMTTGAAGATGGAGGAATCDGCKLEVVYTCLGTGTDSRNFAIEVKNQGSSIVLYKDLTLRYWYTADPSKEQELDCDTAEKLTCNYIVKSTNTPPAPQPKFVSVTPPRTKANEYVELAVVMGALDVANTTGRIQLRLHNKDFSAIDQTADYSYDCGSVGQAHDSSKITAYIRGVLVSGTEP